MYPTQLQFAKITNNLPTTNYSGIVSPTMWVTGKDSRSYTKSPLLDERTAAVLVAMAASGDDFVDLRKLAMSRGKRDNCKNIAVRLTTNTHITRHTTRKNMNFTTASSSGRVGKSLAVSGAHHLSEKIQKRRVSNKKSKKSIGRKEWLASRFDLENYKKGKEAVDGLVGLMEGFGIGGGEKAEDKMEIDMNGLERRMAKLEVIHEDDGEDL